MTKQTDPILLTPGPTPVPPAIRQAMAQPMIHHRSSEFQAILKEAGAGLKEIFKTAQDVYILTSSGTGAMETAVVNILSPGDEALVIQGGKFGERWGEICQAHGIQVTLIDSPWGKPLDLKQVSAELAKHPGIKAVFSTLCETSTGVTFDIRGIRTAMGSSGALLVVDAISGLGAEPFAMDEWGLDVAVSGSQKGLMLPPGLAFIAFSAKAQEAATKSKSRKYYFDLALAKKAWADTDTPFTPAITLIIGLVESLKYIRSVGGVDKLIARNQAQADGIRKSLIGLGFELYADPACASNSVISAKVPAGVDGKDLLKRLRSQYGVIIAGGQGKETGKIIRIASMGAIGPQEIKAGFEALGKVLAEMKTASIGDFRSHV